jgi:hypothetical protein
MNRKEILDKIVEKKEFSNLPRRDVELIFSKFERRETTDEDKIKLTRNLLRKVFFSFGSVKLLNSSLVNKKSSEDILKKHVSTRERTGFYEELYKKIIFKDKDVCVFDLGAGINGFSYNFLPKNISSYIAIESVGQLVNLMNYYFKTRGFEKAFALKESLFNSDKIIKILKQVSEPKIVFLFKVLDSLEMVERNYSKKFLEEIVPLVNRVVVSFATKSLIKRESFRVKRYWFENFIKKKGWKIIEDFELGTERYIVLEK